MRLYNPPLKFVFTITSQTITCGCYSKEGIKPTTNSIVGDLLNHTPRFHYSNIKLSKYQDKIGVERYPLTIGQNFWFNDRHDALALADGGITGQNIGVLHDRLVGWCKAADLDDATPFGEVAAILFVLGATLGEVIET